jgi:hypothetical protein
MAEAGGCITFGPVLEQRWRDDLQDFLDRRFGDFCAAHGQPISPAGLRIGPALGIQEARGFLRGFESRLFEIEVDATIASPMIVRDETNQGRWIFSLKPPPPRIVRTTICLLATASDLVLDRGWPQRQIEIEPVNQESNLTTSGVDILLKSNQNELLAAVVIKRTAFELQKFRTDLHQCCRRGRHGLDNCGFPQNHATFEFSASCKPKYLWAVAPDAEICFQLTYSGETIQLNQFLSLPPRSLFEIQADQVE